MVAGPARGAEGDEDDAGRAVQQRVSKAAATRDTLPGRTLSRDRRPMSTWWRQFGSPRCGRNAKAEIPWSPSNAPLLSVCHSPCFGVGARPDQGPPPPSSSLGVVFLSPPAAFPFSLALFRLPRPDSPSTGPTRSLSPKPFPAPASLPSQFNRIDRLPVQPLTRASASENIRRPEDLLVPLRRGFMQRPTTDPSPLFLRPSTLLSIPSIVACSTASSLAEDSMLAVYRDRSSSPTDHVSGPAERGRLSAG
jgi:hypothetical protein